MEREFYFQKIKYAEATNEIFIIYLGGMKEKLELFVIVILMVIEYFPIP